MKARALFSFSLLLLLACTEHPDSALFSSNSPPLAGSGGGGTSGGGSGSGGVATLPPEGMAGESPAIPGGRGGQATSGGGGGAGVAGTVGDGGEPSPVDAGGEAGTGGEPSPDPAACGNGKLETNEECDDGGQVDGDGCSARCKVACSDFDEDAVRSADLHCYAGYDEATFEEAAAACEERGAHLVTITGEAENRLVRELVRASKWIGAFEEVPITSPEAGEHVWVTTEPFTFENWDTRQPDRQASRCSTNIFTNNSRCYEHCVLMQSDGSWADARCDLVDGYVCEWAPAGF